MQERILGKDLKVSAVGLGCMGFSHAYGDADRGERKRSAGFSRAVGCWDIPFLILRRFTVRQEDPHHQ